MTEVESAGSFPICFDGRVVNNGVGEGVRKQPPFYRDGGALKKLSFLRVNNIKQ